MDYSPYPALEGDLRELALRAISEATSYLSEIEGYLRGRGVEV